MRIATLTFAIALAQAQISAAAAQEAAPTGTQSAIQAVIVDQLAAFSADDMERAFAHASPSIQQRFGTPEGFRRMVQTGYPMVWAPERFEIGALEVREGRLYQTMLFVDREGRVFEADYEMRRIDGVWRINGVTVRMLPGFSS